MATRATRASKVMGTAIDGQSFEPARATTARRPAAPQNADFVPHLKLDEVQLLAAEARDSARHGKGERDALLIQTIFDGCLRVSEAVRLTPASLVSTEHGWLARISGNGVRPDTVVAVSTSLVFQLKSYAQRHDIGPRDRFFPISATRIWQIVDRAFHAAELRKPEHVGAVHVLRHSGALARLAANRNPKALQTQLRHKEARMTLRYLKTFSAMESLKAQQEVDFQW